MLLATGKAMAVRLWQNEGPQEKAPQASPYETLGCVLTSRAEALIGNDPATLSSDDSYLAPANGKHSDRILGTVLAIEWRL